MKSYTIDKDLGQGTFSKVKLGIHKLTGEKVAIKIIDKTKQQESDYVRIHREISILRKLRHPNVVQLFEIVESDSKLYIVTEYASGGELFDHIVSNKRLEEREAARLFIQLIHAVTYIHEHQIVHRDLKPENVLLNEGTLKVVDFGLSSTYQTGQKLKTPCGSPCYAAPEMLQGLSYDGLFTDIWSSGIILYAMICGCVPFEDQNTKRLYEKIKTSDFHLPKYVSLQAADLLKKLLMKDPAQRITLQEIKNHDFIKFAGKYSIPQPLKIDNDIVQQMVQFGLSTQSEIIEMIQGNKHNQITTTYYLLQNKNPQSQSQFSSQTYNKITSQLIQQAPSHNDNPPYVFKIKLKSKSPFQQQQNDVTLEHIPQSPRKTHLENQHNISITKKIRSKTRSQEPIQKREPSLNNQQPLSKQIRQVHIGEFFKKTDNEFNQRQSVIPQGYNKFIITERVSIQNNTSISKIPSRQGRLSFKIEQKPLQTQPNESIKDGKHQKSTSNTKKATELSSNQKLIQMDSIATQIQNNIQNRFLIYKKKIKQ
ncbi:unnamed protein product (macronuclear) [Paramecium tetraurelia]|uniref:Protein kinase domain-containing protein n=1 Tax=Paramecium tetraurelia TaxID=5888 RepID=A0BER8_PARTE|nr:uncharacterized protein GSPATT00028068001 [Paramecium tetraurelia]CAK57035.1 unnamed protein product [Paramecium tetraurelia]|eukprot:XP_001424433.1 hypothetical protein (macronuclear) [Paramecium tetraurelia strain d4-2]